MKKKPYQGCIVGCLGAFILFVTLIFWTRLQPPPKPKPTDPPAIQRGLVDASGRIWSGVKIYSRGGTYEGTVVREVDRDLEGQECVTIKRDDGTVWQLRRAAIRQGNTWFVDPNDPVLR